MLNLAPRLFVESFDGIRVEILPLYIRGIKKDGNNYRPISLILSEKRAVQIWKSEQDRLLLTERFHAVFIRMLCRSSKSA